MVASYNNNEDAPHEPDGVALVWNMKFKKTTPEYVFHCQVGVSMVKITDISFETKYSSCRLASVSCGEAALSLKMELLTILENSPTVTQCFGKVATLSKQLGSLCGDCVSFSFYLKQRHEDEFIKASHLGRNPGVPLPLLSRNICLPTHVDILRAIAFQVPSSL